MVVGKIFHTRVSACKTGFREIEGGHKAHRRGFPHPRFKNQAILRHGNYLGRSRISKINRTYGKKRLIFLKKGV